METFCFQCFHAPNKDTCKRCDEYKIKISISNLCVEEKLLLENGHELYLCKAEKARDLIKEDIVNSENNHDLYVCSIDMQKALPFPILTVSDAYYKRSIVCAYNLVENEFKDESSYCYVLDETKASRGSHEISSCLIKHFDACCVGKYNIIIYSDTCGGQNCNTNVAIS